MRRLLPLVLLTSLFAIASACSAATVAPRSTVAPVIVPIAAPAPTSTTSPPPGAPIEKGLIVDVPKAGNVIVDGSPIADDALREAFAQRTGDDVAIIRAGDATAWERIVAVLDAIRSRPNRAVGFVLASRDDATRRTTTLHFPSMSDAPLPPPPAPPPPPRAVPRGGAVADEPIDFVTEMVSVVSLEMGRDGKLTVEGRPLEGALRDWLRVRLASGTHRVVLFGDTDAPFGAIVDAVRDTQAEGATIAFGIRPASSPPSGATAGATPPKPTLRPGGFPKCPFPTQVDAKDIDSAAVMLRIKVDAAGQVTDVAIVADPGHGFGAAARACARKAPFDPARDEKGRAIAGDLVLRVRFERQ